MSTVFVTVTFRNSETEEQEDESQSVSMRTWKDSGATNEERAVTVSETVAEDGWEGDWAVDNVEWEFC